jgi:hypothetical protein
LRTFILFPFLAALAVAPARGAPLVLSDLSSDDTPASVLPASFDFQVADGTLTFTVSNPASASYNVAEAYFNAASHVTGLTLRAASHSDAGDVSGTWLLVDSGGSGQPTRAGGFGVFGFALSGPHGANDPALIGPAESVVFTLSIAGMGPFDMADFVTRSANGNPSALAAAKFVNGPAANDPTEQVEDSAFGAVVPEPASGWLLAGGLAAFARLRLAARRATRESPC